MSRFSLSWLLIAALALAGLAACAAPAPVSQEPAVAPSAPTEATLNVLAVETFLADIAQNIAGDRLQVAALMPIGVDPHAFEPTPQDVVKVSESQVLIVNSAGLEPWLARVLENAGGSRIVLEAAAGLVMRQPAAEEPTHEHDHDDKHDHDHDDHSIESHAALVCAQLAGKSAEETVQAGPDAENPVALHTEHEHEDEPEHEHEDEHDRELLILRLNPQADGTFAGFVLFDAEIEDGYAVTTMQGQVAVTTAEGEPVAVAQELPLDCAGMTQGLIFKLTPGEYIIALTGFTAESTPFSVAPVHGHAEGAHDHEDEHAEGAHDHEDEHADDHHHHHEGDPHFWLDPIAVIKYAENIRDGLSQADPAGAAVYAANATAYVAKLNELDAWIRAQVAEIPAERRLLVTNHESFGYFADRYGFTIVGTVIPGVSTAASPSAQDLARLVSHIRETAAPAIFLETGANPQLARQLSLETGIKVITDLMTHSITGPNGAAPTYLAMMRYNVETVVDALK